MGLVISNNVVSTRFSALMRLNLIYFSLRNIVCKVNYKNLIRIKIKERERTIRRRKERIGK